MPKDPLASSSRARKKKNNNDDPMGVSQSARKPRRKKDSEKKVAASPDIDRSTKKKKVITPKKDPGKKDAGADGGLPSSGTQKTDKHASAKEVRKSKPEKHHSCKEIRKEEKHHQHPPPAAASREPSKNEKSPKYEVDPKVIETPHVEKVKVEGTLKSEDDNEKKKKKEPLARPESIRLGLKKCVHMWPTPADMEKLKSAPKPWSIPQIRQTQNLEYFLGRVPQWYIEEKFLKNPGDFLVSRDPANKYILSVKTKESGNPCAHFVIEFAETQLVRNDRNYYHRLVGTVPQCNTVQGLVQKYRDSATGMLKQNTKRDAELLTPILPCQSCIYSLQEYNYHYVFVRNPKDVVTKDLIAYNKVEGYKLFKGTRAVHLPTLTETIVVRPAVVKEYDAQTAETLDIIFREMHIVQTIRFKIGVNTVVNIEGIVTVQKPFHVLYKVCSEGALMQYFETHRDEVMAKDKVSLLQDIACTLYQVYKLGYLHCDICAKNIFVDIKELIIKELKEINEPKKPRFYVGGWKTSVMESTKKLDIDKHPPHAHRYLAPESLTTNILNESTEVYAFGLMMYEVFVSEKPWKDIADGDMKKQLHDNPTSRPSLPDLIPQDVQKLIKECLLEDAAKRPPMIEVWKRLRAIGDPAVKSMIQKTQQA